MEMINGNGSKVWPELNSKELLLCCLCKFPISKRYAPAGTLYAIGAGKDQWVHTCCKVAQVYWKTDAGLDELCEIVENTAEDLEL